METKVCKKCGIEKNIEEYRVQKNRNGTFRYCSWCKKCDKEYTNEWKRKHQAQIYTKRIDYFAKYNKYYWNKNGIEIMKKRNKYFAQRRNDDYLFKFKEQIRNLINISLKTRNHVKNTKTSEILGCDLDFFVNYILETYKKNYGYEWDGKEKVHIDHIIPLATAKTEKDVIKLCHYTNLQLLKAQDNLKKGAKIIENEQNVQNVV